MKTLNMFLGRLLVSMLVVSLVYGLLSPTHPTLSTIALPTLSAMLTQYLMDFVSGVEKVSAGA